MADTIEQWLADLDLAKYVDAFVGNEVGLRDLPHLTDADLRELGLPLGPRKRVLGAARSLAEEAEQPAAPQAERRQVTVLFADISGFTALSERLGAERTHEMLTGFFAAADAAILRFGGTIDKHIGDAVMAVFGAPLAHTDDPERAVRAAAELHEVVRTLEPPLSVHIGVASGQVVASRLGSESHTEYTVTGESVNLASRLTDLAGPGETLASAAVARGLGNRIEGALLGPRMIEGLPEPIDVWRLERVSDPTEVVATTFVGRLGERRLFEEAVERCLSTGGGGTILVRGEAGIGKTRLLHEFDRRARERGFDSCTGLVLDFGAGKGQDAIGSLVRGLLDLDPGSGKAERAAAADHAIAEGLLAGERRPHLNDLLDLPQPDDLRSLYEAMDNETRALGRQETLTGLVAGHSERRPLLLRIEDLHWADQATLEQTAALARAVVDCAALLVLTTRNAGDPVDDDWLQRAGPNTLTTLELGPLDEVEAAGLAHEFADLEAGLVATCVARAGGNPLFLEQLLRNVDELADGNIPGSVQGIVQARLDAIPAIDRQALQAAGVLGQRFTLAALHRVADLPDYNPDRLLAAALIRPVSGGYLFGHALIRDGALASMLSPQRRELHLRAAAWFAERDTLLHANHLDAAEDPGAAAAYLTAAREFEGNFRYDDAMAAIERGVEIAKAADLRFDLEHLHGDVLRSAGHTDQSIEAFRAALATAPDDTARCRTLIGIAAGLRVLGQADETLAILDQAQPLAAAQDLPLELARIHQFRGNIAFLNGDVDVCMTEQQQAMTHAREAGSAEIEAQAYSGLADGHYMAGRMRSSLRNFDRVLEIARAHDILSVDAGCVPAVAHTTMFQNRLVETRQIIVEGLELIRRVGHRRAEVIVRLNLASLLCEFGEARVGLEESERAAAIIEQIGARVWEPLAWSNRGRCLHHLGEPGQAVEAARQGAELARETSRALLGAWCMGILALVADDPEERQAALTEGEEMLEGRVVAHCHLWFYRDAMDACLRVGDYAAADRYAGLLEDFTRDEPMPWTDFFIARGRTLAAHARTPDDPDMRKQLTDLRQTARDIHMGSALPAIERALESG
ncbi:MAG: tetratricopeptide repeat protein [Alphaproteobacteria bacterium]|nr:tetratricopeptide repeat protein [Alphaproteobacteria bacterium]MDP6814984.1 tetratricopeptide repeat protein [Alphaproteobacteria bacterium]